MFPNFLTRGRCWAAVLATMVIPVNAEARHNRGRDIPRSEWITSYYKTPLAFERSSQTQYVARAAGYTLLLSDQGAEFVFPDCGASGVSKTGRKATVVWNDARVSPQVSPSEELPGRTNFFLGNDPARWRTNVAAWSRVHYAGIYPAVDLVFYGNQRQLEFDFVAQPGANPGVVELALDGPGAWTIDSRGNLALPVSCRTAGATSELRIQKPFVYQEYKGSRKKRAGRFVWRGKNRVGFEVEGYDRTRPLVIDPVLSYSTHWGGSLTDTGVGIAVDRAGNAYITGTTESVDFPTTQGAFDRTCGDDGNCNRETFLPLLSDNDIFVAKLSPDGSSVVYSTYLGGALDEFAGGIAVDAVGNAYVTGRTFSPDFPTVHAIQDVNHGSTDAFVAKLNPAGSALIYSTFLGGEGEDGGNVIVVDAEGNAYVAGASYGSAGSEVPFPTTPGVFQPSYYTYGTFDAFVAKISPDGGRLVYSTLLGADGDDDATGIAVDSSGSAYVTGDIFSGGSFPTTPGAFHGDCCGTAFVTKLSPDASRLIYSSYIGPNGVSDVEANDIAVDTLGQAYVTGSTNTGNFQVTPGVFQTTFKGGQDAFVMKVSADGSSLIYSTFLGGSSNNDAQSLAIDAAGNAWVAGNTGALDFPRVKAIQPPLGGFLVELNASGSSLLLSTGVGYGTLRQIALDASGNVYLTGLAGGIGMPILNAVQPAAHGDDAFVMKISPADAAALASDPGAVVFPVQLVPSSSEPVPVIISNAGTLPLTLGSITISGDFTQTNACPAVLEAAQSCQLSVIFRPAVVGARTGAITITDNSPGNPHRIPVSGVGSVTPAVNLQQTHLQFGRQLVGRQVSSGPPDQTTTLNNYGVAPLNIGQTAITGANPQDFTKGVNGCDGASVPPGGLCNMFFYFTPTAAGTRTAFLSIPSNAPGSPHLIALEGTGVVVPTFSAESVVGAANFGSVAPGGIASIFGEGLSVSTLVAGAPPLPRDLGELSLIIGYNSAPLFFVSPGQINFQVPWDVYISMSVMLSLAPGATRTVIVPVAFYAPGIFSMNAQGSGQGAVLIAGTQDLAAPSGAIRGSPSRPVLRGEYISIYCTGLGPVTYRPALGAAASAKTLSSTTKTPVVTVGGVAAPVTDGFFSGLAPGFVGLYQVNVQIPGTAPSGDAVPIQISIEGVSSNVVTIAVQ